MDRLPFDPKDLEIVGYMPAFNPRAPKIPIYNTPVSKRENYLMFLNGETPHWLPHMNDQFLFLPECVPDNWCRGMVTASKPVSIDMFGGNLLTGLIKHSQAHDASRYVEDAKRDLAVFQNELQDVRDLQGLNVEVGDFLTFADFFWDGLLADILVQSRINDARRKIADAIRRTEDVVQRLKSSL